MTPALARAEPTPDRGVVAQERFDQARTLIESGRYREACPKLEDSQALDPGSGTLINLADCYEHVGRLAEAWSKFVEAAAASRAAGNNDREKVARDRAAILAAKLPKIFLQVTADTTSGLEIRLDGNEIPRAEWQTARPAAAGPHAITASAPGRKAWRSTIELKGDAGTSKVEVPELESTSPEAPAGLWQSLGPKKTLALAAGTVGIIGVAVGTVFGVRKIVKHHEADSYCDGTTCFDQRGVDLADEATKAGTVATIAFAVGGIALAGGTVLWLTSSPSRSVSSVGIGVGAIHVGGVW